MDKVMNFWVVFGLLIGYIISSYYEKKDNNRKAQIFKVGFKYITLLLFLFILLLSDLDLFYEIFTNGDLSEVSTKQALVLFGIVIVVMDITETIFDLTNRDFLEKDL